MKRLIFYIIFLLACSISNAGELSSRVCNEDGVLEQILDIYGIHDIQNEDFVEETEPDYTKHIAICLTKIMCFDRECKIKIENPKCNLNKKVLLNTYLDIPPPFLS